MGRIVADGKLQEVLHGPDIFGALTHLLLVELDVWRGFCWFGIGTVRPIVVLHLVEQLVKLVGLGFLALFGVLACLIAVLVGFITFRGRTALHGAQGRGRCRRRRCRRNRHAHRACESLLLCLGTRVRADAVRCAALLIALVGARHIAVLVGLTAFHGLTALLGVTARTLVGVILIALVGLAFALACLARLAAWLLGALQRLALALAGLALLVTWLLGALQRLARLAAWLLGTLRLFAFALALALALADLARMGLAVVSFRRFLVARLICSVLLIARLALALAGLAFFFFPLQPAPFNILLSPVLVLPLPLLLASFGVLPMPLLALPALSIGVGMLLSTAPSLELLALALAGGVALAALTVEDIGLVVSSLVCDGNCLDDPGLRSVEVCSEHKCSASTPQVFQTHLRHPLICVRALPGHFLKRTNVPAEAQVHPDSVHRHRACALAEVCHRRCARRARA